MKMSHNLNTLPRKSLHPLLTVLLSIMVLCLIIEAGFRIWYGHPARPVRWLAMGGNHQRYLFMPDPDPEIGYRLRPYFEGFEIQPDGDFVLPAQINPWGLRDSHDLRGLRSFRVLAVGDSYTYGEGVPLEKTFLAVIEQKLRASGLEADVINAGVPGYSIRQMSKLARVLGPVIRPQVVLATFRSDLFSRESSPLFYSDGYIFQGSLNRELLCHFGEWTIFARPASDRFRGADLFLQRHSVLYLYLKYPVYQRLTHPPLKKKGRALKKEQLVEGFYALIKLDQWCGERNVTLVAIPLCVDDQAAALLDQMLAEHRLAGKSVVITDWRRGSASPQRLTFTHDSHLNEDGHALVAGQVFSILMRSLHRTE